MCNYCGKKGKTSGLLKKPDNRNDSLFENAFCFILGSVLVIEYNAYSCDSSFVESVEIKFCPMCGRELGGFKDKQSMTVSEQIDQFGGNTRDALNVALTRLEQMEMTLAAVRANAQMEIVQARWKVQKEFIEILIKAEENLPDSQ